MKKNLIRFLSLVLFFSVVFFGVAKTKIANAQTYQTINVKCNCTTAFSTCGNYFGQTNVKRRTCAGAVNGAQTCTVATLNPVTFWQVVACAAGGTPTPTPTGGAVTPTPTINVACVCNTAGACSSQCQSQFSKYPATVITTYSNPIKCGVAATFFQTAPTAGNKNDWCRRPQKTKGDADGNDKINLMDYFYYVQAKSGGKIPAQINPDFNGDNAINNEDRIIILKTL